jgi:hypothetical protein
VYVCAADTPAHNSNPTVSSAARTVDFQTFFHARRVLILVSWAKHPAGRGLFAGCAHAAYCTLRERVTKTVIVKQNFEEES